jgi:hypothetical protein
MTEIIQLDESICTVSEVLKRSSNLKKILVLGVDSDDNPFFAMSGMDAMEMIYYMERCKQFIMRMSEE